MNHAIFAIPGLMPPKAVNWRRQLIAPEDGSLYMLIHCGYATDIVNYSLILPGWRHGIIKDPGYNFLWPDWEALCSHHHHDHKAKHSHCHANDPCFWPQFMTVSDQCPPDVLIPRRKIHGCPISIDELTDAEPPELRYFILKLPPRALPVGDTLLDVTVNGHVYHYIVQRPMFSIHAWNRNCYVKQPCIRHKENHILVYNALVTQDKEGALYLPDFIGVLRNKKPLRATAILNGEKVDLTIERGSQWVIVRIPAGLNIGAGVWKAEIEAKRDSWIPFAGGELIIAEKLPEETVPEPDEDPEDGENNEPEEKDPNEEEDSDDQEEEERKETTIEDWD